MLSTRESCAVVRAAGDQASLATLIFSKVFPSGMKTAPGEVSEGHFRW
jgi:hypothetical protein